jgi:lipoprotein-releasing system permease protein
MTLIALMSVTVISLVVWLIVLFLSVTDGIEKTWLDKLTSLHAPVRITPTQDYFSSYHYLSDTISQKARYTPRTLQEKIAQGDLYNPDIDETVPAYWPKKEADPVQTAYQILADLKKNHPDLAFQDFELSGAMLRLQLVRPSGTGGISHQFLTQASYLASFADESPAMKKLLLAPTIRDLEHLLFLAQSDAAIVPALTSHTSYQAKDGEVIEGQFTTSFKDVPTTTPFWVHEVREKLVLPRLSSERGIVIAKQFQDTGVRIGDKGWLSYPAATAGALQEQRLPIYVAGFYDPGVLTIGNKCILAPPSIVHLINTTSQVEHFDKMSSIGFSVWLKNIKLSPQLAEEIKQKFAQSGIDKYWKVATYHEFDFAKDLLQQFQSDRYLFTLIGLIILLVACSNIISLLIILVNDKKKEIGILQALGASKKSIAVIFGGAGACLGVVSGLIGVGAAILTLQNLDAVVKMLSFVQGHQAFNTVFYGNSLPHELSTQAIIFVFIVTPILSLIAGLIPAWKACRLTPSQILRSE